MYIKLNSSVLNYVRKQSIQTQKKKYSDYGDEDRCNIYVIYIHGKLE